MIVILKKPTLVKPASDTPKRGIWVSNLDLIVPRVHIFVLHFYASCGSSNFFDFKVLEEALSKALVPFYPAAGRLKRAADGRIEINCNGEGAMLVEASTSCVLDDLGDFAPSAELAQLIPHVDYSQDISSYPILVAQVTYFECGGVSIGVGIHHTVVDGISAAHFTDCWSKIARGRLDHSDIPTFVDRSLLKARDPPTPLFNHVEYQDPPVMKAPPEPHQSKTTPVVAKLTISPEHLNLLKKSKSISNGNGVGHHEENGRHKHSSFEIVAAHVWRCLCKARNLAQDQLTKMYIPTNGRDRLCPPLPPGYFGNVTYTASPVAAVRDVVSGSNTFAVSTIHDALARMDDEYLRSALDYLELQPDLTQIIRRADTFKCPNAGFVSWAKLPLYDADFGWGKPTYVGPVKVLFEGQAYVLPRHPDEGGLFLIISLQQQHMESFKKCFYDVNYICEE
ncbi:hypothetical protein ACLOJK_041618 [Asimina triloba]